MWGKSRMTGSLEQTVYNVICGPFSCFLIKESTTEHLDRSGCRFREPSRREPSRNSVASIFLVSSEHRSTRNSKISLFPWKTQILLDSRNVLSPIKSDKIK